MLRVLAPRPNQRWLTIAARLPIPARWSQGRAPAIARVPIAFKSRAIRFGCMRRRAIAGFIAASHWQYWPMRTVAHEAQDDVKREVPKLG